MIHVRQRAPAGTPTRPGPTLPPQPIPSDQARGPRGLASKGLGDCRRGSVALEFVLASAPMILLVFGFIATSAVFNTWSNMQSNAQYAARMMSTGQIKNLANGALTTTNTTNTTACSGTLTNTQVEYYACNGLPSWTTYSVTATENCAVPSVTVSLTASAATAAIADVAAIFTGKNIVAQAVVMKEGSCP